jgi:hypothetical protein
MILVADGVARLCKSSGFGYSSIAAIQFTAETGVLMSTLAVQVGGQGLEQPATDSSMPGLARTQWCRTDAPQPFMIPGPA